MLQATITSNGQMTIPKAIRALLNLQPGDRIDFAIEGDRVYLRPVNRSVKRLFGSLHHPDGPRLTDAELQADLEQAVADDVMRSLER